MEKVEHGSHEGVVHGGHHDGHQEQVNSVFGRMGQKLDKYLTPAATYFAYVGAATLGILVAMLIVSIVTRRVFNAPLSGAFEMTELGLIIITYTILAYHLLKHEVMTVDIIERYFPKKVKAVLEVVIKFLTICMLGVLCWQLIVYGIRIQGFHQTTRYLQIQIFPFVYLGAAGIFMLALVYLKYLLFSLDRAVKK
jgi:TRAP-type C4-dicarboxylate transport system permease small subunit